MNLSIFDKSTRQIKGVINRYEYLAYTKENVGPGSFELEVPLTEPSVELLEKGSYIYFGKGIVGIVKRIMSIESDEQTVSISGFLFAHIFEYRSFLTTTKYNDYLDNVIKQAFTDLFLNPEKVARKISFLKISSQYNSFTTEDKINFQNTGDDFLKAFNELCLTNDVTIDLYPNISKIQVGDGYVTYIQDGELRLKKVADRTIGNTQGNIPIVFGYDFNNLETVAYDEDARSTRNVAIVASEGEGEQRKILEVGETQATGINRIELYVDARDLQQGEEGSSSHLTDAEFEEMMRQRGEEKLLEKCLIISFDATTNVEQMKYKVEQDFFVGDYVSVLRKRDGKFFNLQIMSYTRTISDGIEHLDIVFGTDRLKIKQLKEQNNVVAEVSGGGAGEKGEDGVGIADIEKTSTSGLVDTYTITYTDSSSSTFDVTNGADGAPGATGPQGPQGATGPQGASGSDGVSPEVTITSISGGHRVTITDADHPLGQSFDVMDGSGSGDMAKSDYDDNLVVYNSGGIVPYVTYKTGQVISEVSTMIGAKADKVTGGTAGNFVTLDSSGNLQDGGSKPSDFASNSALQNLDSAVSSLSSDVSDVIAGLNALDANKADKVSNATNGNFAGLDSNGNLVDSGNKASDFKMANAHDSWSDVTNKPFNTVSTDAFKTTNNVLDINFVAVYNIARYASDGSASTYGYRGVKASGLYPGGTTGEHSAVIEYVMKQTATATSYIFTNSTAITNDRLIDVYSSIYGENPTSVTQSGSTVTVTFAESKSRTVAIVLK